MPDMSEIRHQARKYALEHYGNLVYAEEPRYDSYLDKYTVNLSVHYPRLIVNDATNERIINVLTLQKICQLHYNAGGAIVDPPKKEECLNGLNQSLNLWNERIERIVTKAASNELAGVQTVHHFLNPIEVIMNWIYHYNALSEEDIKDLTRSERYWDWINLLKSLDIITLGEGKFGLGSIGQGLREKSRGKDELVRNVISHILYERYSYLEEIMNIKVLSTLIHANSCYYRYCIDADRIVKKNPRSIHQQYERIYGKRSYVEFFNSLMELSKGRVIRYEKPYFTANEEIFDRISSSKIEPIIAPPF
jgi:hypothetical protein